MFEEPVTWLRQGTPIELDFGGHMSVSSSDPTALGSWLAVAHTVTGAAGPLLQLVQAAGSGTYFRPAPRRERLHTNLLEVTCLPQLIYWAKTDSHGPKDFREELKKQLRYPPGEWLLDDKLVLQRPRSP